MEAFIKKFINELYDGKFGVIFSRAQTRIKYFKKIEGEEVLIRYKDAINKKQGIQILFNYKSHSYEIKFRGKTYKKLVKRIIKYLEKNKFENGTVQEI